MAPLPRQRLSAKERRAFAMFNASPHCMWDPVKRLGAAGEWCASARVWRSVFWRHVDADA
jgi:hypothetical protein